MKDERLVWLALAMIFDSGNSRVWELSANYDNAEEFYLALKNHSVTGVSDEEIKRADKIDMSDIEKIIDDCNKQDINVYCYESEGYPEQLRGIANPPIVLFTYGNLDFLNDMCVIAVVGTRKPSDYSLEVADKLCGDIIDRNILLASGFANGIDQTVNKVSIKHNLPAVAVCGTALDYDYPKGSCEFKKQIAKNGVVISEYFPGTKPMGQSFVTRNRILVGISRGVLFIEAGRNSHGLDNYIHATAQGKPVFVVPPHNLFDSRYYGQRYLIRNECVPVFNADDVVYFLSYDGFENIKLVKSMGEFNLPADDSAFYSKDDLEVRKRRKRKAKKSENKSSQNDSEHTDIIASVDYSQLDETETAICRVLEGGKTLADTICIRTGIDIGTVLSTLTMLEIDGVVESFPGKQFGLAKQNIQNGE